MVLQALAKRIARNREIAGFHYKSDSDAGADLADAIFGILTDPSQVPKFTDAMSTAKDEWS